MRRIIAFSVLVGFTGTAFAADTWTVREGAEGRVKGTWTVEQKGAAVSGSALMQGGGTKPITYNLTGRVDGAHYTVRRVNPSDGLDCSYTGTAEKNDPRTRTFEINGTANCRGKGAMWSVRRLPAKSKF